MADWSDAERVRNDDPYHSWAYNRAHAKPVDGGKSAPEMLCPVIISAKASDGTILTLIPNLVAILEEVRGPNPKYLMSPYDQAHLDATIEELKRLRGKDPNRPVSDYARMFLIYVLESVLFGDSSGNCWESEYFCIEFVGRSIVNIVSSDIRLQNIISPRAGVEICLTIIDDSMAFLNEEFVSRDDENKPKSKFSEIWLQQSEVVIDGHPISGIRVTGEDIDAVLKPFPGKAEFDKYSSPMATNGGDFVPMDLESTAHQPLAFGISHGTHVATSALQSFEEHNDGKELDLFAVTVPTEATEDTSGSSVGSYLLAAIRQAMLWNDLHYQGEEDRVVPLVINFSYGFTAGPKDGSARLNDVIRRLVDSRNEAGRPTALVVPMGNGYYDRSVAQRELDPGASVDMDWVLQPDDRTSSFLEIFAKTEGGGDANFTLELTAPDGGISGEMIKADGSYLEKSRHLKDGDHLLAEWGEWGEWRECSDQEGDRHETIWNRRIVIALAPTFSHEDPDGTVPAGHWTLRFTNTSDEKIEIWALVQRDDAPGTYPTKGRQSYLDHPDAHVYGDGEVYELTASYDQLSLDGPLTHLRTASVFAANESNHVFAVGAGMGVCGDASDGSEECEGDTETEGSRTGEVHYPLTHSPYAASGPRAGTSCQSGDHCGPDVSALADRSRHFWGVYAAGTYSGVGMRMNGSSAAAPWLAGFLAANPALIEEGRDALSSRPNPPAVGEKSLRFGLAASAV